MFENIWNTFFGKKAEATMIQPQTVTADPNRVRYIIMDMHHTATGNPDLVRGLAAFKEQYNIKIIACGTGIPGDTEKTLSDMGVSDLVDYVRYPCLEHLVPFLKDNETVCSHQKSDPQFYENITIDGQKILPQDMFLIDDLDRNCQAIRMAGGQFHHFGQNYKNETDNALAFSAVRNWLAL